MLTVTDDAATAMRSALERADLPVSTGMRISSDGGSSLSDNDSRPTLRLDVATGDHDGDAIVEAPGGIQVFIESDVAPLLENKVLDGMIEPNGRAAFRITNKAL